MGNASGKKKTPTNPPPTAPKETTPQKPQMSAEEIERRKKRAIKRQKVVNELLSTERTYVRLLELCIINFMMPLDPSTRSRQASVQRTGSVFQRYTTDIKTPTATNATNPTDEKNNNDTKTDEKENESKTGNNLGSPSSASSITLAQPYPNAYKIMSQKDHKLLFSDLKMICGLNQTFLQGLEAIIDGGNWDQDKARLSDPFEKFSPFFTMYQNYMNNYDAANECYHTYSRKTDFQQFENYARTQCDGQNLQSLIILPIQRLPRYKLLLSEILKQTEEDHIDYISLKESLSKIDETTKLINERMKEHEARAKVRKMESRFTTQVSWVKPSRSFIKDGKLNKIDRTGKSELLVFLLFSDMLVYASESTLTTSNDDDDSNSLKLRQEIPINKVFNVKNIEENVNGKIQKFGDRGFEIRTSVKSFIVFANSKYEKDQWMKALIDVAGKQKSILSKRLSQHKEESKSTDIELFEAPLLIPDDYSDVCMRCDTKFTTINRRHHCRYCGFIICGKCGNNQLASRKDKTKIVKLVCKVCYEENKDKYPRPKNGLFDDDVDDDDDENQGHTKSSSMAKLTNVFKGK